MKIAIGSDHAGFGYKEKIKDFLTTQGHEVLDFGTLSTDSVDYPDFAHPTSAAVEKGEVKFGILICGSGQGVNMTANKHQRVRSALCSDTDLVRLSRMQNNANVIALPGRFGGVEYAIEMVDVCLNTELEGVRHQNRGSKISC